MSIRISSSSSSPTGDDAVPAPSRGAANNRGHGNMRYSHLRDATESASQNASLSVIEHHNLNVSLRTLQLLNAGDDEKNYLEHARNHLNLLVSHGYENGE
jgi:hypothetical protein